MHSLTRNSAPRNLFQKYTGEKYEMTYAQSYKQYLS